MNFLDIQVNFCVVTAILGGVVLYMGYKIFLTELRRDWDRKREIEDIKHRFYDDLDPKLKNTAIFSKLEAAEKQKEFCAIQNEIFINLIKMIEDDSITRNELVNVARDLKIYTHALDTNPDFLKEALNLFKGKKL